MLSEAIHAAPGRLRCCLLSPVSFTRWLADNPLYIVSGVFLTRVDKQLSLSTSIYIPRNSHLYTLSTQKNSRNRVRIGDTFLMASAVRKRIQRSTLPSVLFVV
jgi:hypothetical protein